MYYPSYSTFILSLTVQYFLSTFILPALISGFLKLKSSFFKIKLHLKDLNLFLVRYFKKTDPIGKTLIKFMYFLIFVVKFILYPIPYIYVGMQRFIKFLAHQSILGMKFNGPFKYMTASDNKGPL